MTLASFYINLMNFFSKNGLISTFTRTYFHKFRQNSLKLIPSPYTAKYILNNLRNNKFIITKFS